MRSLRLFILASSVSLITAVSSAGGIIREPWVSGSFYPDDNGELSRTIDHFLDLAPADGAKENAKLAALIVPHAGYVYSGQTAAYSYKRLEGTSFGTVVLLGPYHRAYFPGAAIWRSGAWRTPLGEVLVDTEVSEAIAKENLSFKFEEELHLQEHSLEVHVPFLQKTLRDFKIVPILVSDDSPQNCALLAKAIVKSITGKKALVIASTDMSHYRPDGVTRQMDGRTLEFLKEKDTEGLLKANHEGTSELCGIAATATVLEIARLLGDTSVEILKYSHSGEVTGDNDRVVGYSALAVYEKNSKGGLDKAAEDKLLKLSRRTLETYLRTGEITRDVEEDPALNEKRAVFVTLRENGELRGCIGRTLPEESLYLAVRNMTIESATQDPRFSPVTAAELDQIEIEISVLSVPERVYSADEISLGTHGVILRSGRHGGVFLPKVAEETGWNKELFLGELCSQKAGLPWDCWKDPAVELYVFTAEDFGEN